MANYPIKVLVDEKGQEFIPISSTGALLDPTGQNLDTILASKLETNSIIAGSGITLNKNATNHTVEINCSLPGASVIDNLTTTTAGQGSLDAHQGYILNTTKVNISDIVNNVTSTDADKPLSAYQGYLLSNRIPNKISDLTNDSGFITSSYHDDTKVDKGVTLFDGATGGNVVLSDTPSNYKTLDIYYNVGNATLVQTVKANSAYFVLTLSEMDAKVSGNMGIINHYKNYIVNDKTFVVNAAGRLFKYQNDTNVTQDTIDYIWIMKVIGYK